MSNREKMKTSRELSSVGAGVIDSDYRGEIGVLLFNQGQEDVVIKIGDRVAQIIFEKISVPKIEKAAELPQTSRGDAGFGSTGSVNFVSKLVTKEQEEAVWREHNPAHWGAEKIFWALKKERDCDSIKSDQRYCDQM